MKGLGKGPSSNMWATLPCWRARQQGQVHPRSTSLEGRGGCATILGPMYGSIKQIQSRSISLCNCRYSFVPPIHWVVRHSAFGIHIWHWQLNAESWYRIDHYIYILLSLEDPYDARVVPIVASSRAEGNSNLREQAKTLFEEPACTQHAWLWMIDAWCGC